MKAKKKPRKIPARALKSLKKIAERLTLENCTVAQEHKDALKIFLDTWVRPQLATLIAYGEGEIPAEEIR